MTDCFAHYFSSVFSNSEPDCSENYQICDFDISEVRISVTDVYNVLSSLDPNSALGEDGLHPKLLKNLAHSLANPLTIIVNASLQTSSLPSYWLTSLVVPIYEKASRYGSVL